MNELNRNDESLKEMWNTINKLTNKNSKTTNITEVLYDGQILTELSLIANSFNNYFNEIGPSLADELSMRSALSEYFIKPNSSRFELTNVSEF